MLDIKPSSYTFAPDTEFTRISLDSSYLRDKKADMHMAIDLTYKFSEEINKLHPEARNIAKQIINEIIK